LIEVRRATSQAEVAAALDLRERVFCGEQGVSLEADQDGLDPEALHVVALDGERVVGTCRLLFSQDGARLGRMAVDAGMRGRGIGASLLDEGEREARAAGARRMTLHAQVVATPLYERAGYEVAGSEYLDEGIPHVPMEKSLA
jgi:putative N-acetyltransferase (TIGR04045 family)